MVRATVMVATVSDGGLREGYGGLRRAARRAAEGCGDGTPVGDTDGCGGLRRVAESRSDGTPVGGI